MASVNDYVRFQFELHGHEPPKKLLQKRAVQSAIRKACDRTAEGTMRNHLFEVPPGTLGSKEMTVKFEV